MDKAEALKLLSGGPEGIREWNNRRREGETIPSLNGVSLVGALMSGVDLSRVELAGADLSYAELAGADLTRADLGGAVLKRTRLSDAVLMNVNLTGAILTSAIIDGAILLHAKLNRAVLAGANISHAKLFDADLEGADFTGAILTGADFTGANRHGADFTHADAGGTNVAMDEEVPTDPEDPEWGGNIHPDANSAAGLQGDAVDGNELPTEGYHYAGERHPGMPMATSLQLHLDRGERYQGAGAMVAAAGAIGMMLSSGLANASSWVGFLTGALPTFLVLAMAHTLHD